jgi:hypothetical protein
MSYATLADLKSYLDISSASDDALLTALLQRATALIDRRTGVTFQAATDTTRTLAPQYAHERTLWLPPRWMLAQAATTIVSPAGVTIPASAVCYHPPDAPYVAIRLIDTAYSWHDGTDDISITGRWGWSVTPPADIVHATIRLAAWLYRQRSASSDLDRPTVADGGLVVLPLRLPRDIEQLLASYTVVL